MAYLLLKQAAIETKHPEHRLRQWCKQGKIRFAMAGNRYIINTSWLSEDLEKMAIENLKPKTENVVQIGQLRRIGG